MTSPLVEIKNAGLTLSGRAGEVEILKDIDLTIDAGACVGVVGASGSGKTSLLMVMAGLEQASSGSITVCGEDFRSLDEDALARVRGQEIGIVFQSFHLIPTMTALENVALPLEFSFDDTARDRAAELLARVGLEHRSGHLPSQLSGGEQQRVAIARALAPRPKLLLADEPTGNLDMATSEKIIDLIFSLQESEGITLVLVTHDGELAERCERVVRLEDGRLAYDSGGDQGTADNLEPAA